MIQRIQSIYLFISAVGLGLFAFLPLGKSSAEQMQFTIAESQDVLPLLIIVLTSIAATLFAIFLFKNRILQKNIVKFAVLLNFALIGLLVYYFFFQEATKLATVYPNALLVMLSLILNFLAIRGIDKDEKLIRSIDRLR